VCTYFLLNRESRAFIDIGSDVFKLTHNYGGDRRCRIADAATPEAVVAHDERRIRKYYAETGCTLVELGFGDWCGRSSILGLQDFAIAVKEPSDAWRQGRLHRLGSRIRGIPRAFTSLRFRGR
jgi:hypothetical protein